MHPSLIPIFLFANDENARFQSVIPTDQVYLYFDGLIKTGFNDVLTLNRTNSYSSLIDRTSLVSSSINNNQQKSVTIKREDE